MSRNRRGKDWEREVPRGKLDGHLPHSPGAEASILGGVLLSNDTLALIDTIEVLRGETWRDIQRVLVRGVIKGI